MLAPLKDRSLLEREPTISADERIAQLEAANAVLTSALRQSRQAMKRNATLAARQSVAQANEISRLETLYHATRQRLAALESGQAIIELGRQLLALSAANDQLRDASHQLWRLDKCLGAAHAECARLARERDQAVRRLLDRRQQHPLQPD